MIDMGETAVGVQPNEVRRAVAARKLLSIPNNVLVG